MDTIISPSDWRYVLTSNAAQPAVAPSSRSVSRLMSAFEVRASLPLVALGCAPTNIGNAQRFARRFWGRVGYCHSLNVWFFHAGGRWSPITDETMFELAAEVVSDITVEVFKASSRDEQRMLLEHAARSKRRRRLRRMLSLAESAPGIAILPPELAIAAIRRFRCG